MTQRCHRGAQNQRQDTHLSNNRSFHLRTFFRYIHKQDKQYYTPSTPTSVFLWQLGHVAICIDPLYSHS